MQTAQTNEWGPLPELEKMLQAATRSKSLAGMLDNKEAESRGGLWGAYGERGDFRDVLSRCHFWISMQIAEFLRPLFPEFEASPPLPLFQTSQRAVAWALSCCVLDTQGPRAFANFPSSLDGTYKLGDSALLGDLLALHIFIERIVIGRSLEAAAPVEIDGRSLSSLRKPAFIRRYRASAVQAARLGRWRHYLPGRDRPFEALNRFIAASPLTQLVYLDLLEPALATLPNAFGNVRDAAHGVAQAAWSETERGIWMAWWFSHLARALTAVMLSQPACYEQLKQAERRLGQAIENRGPLVTLLGRKTGEEVYWQKQCNALRGRICIEYAGRLGYVKEVFSRQPYLQVATLDMLVRQLAVKAAGDVRAVWKAAKADARRDPKLLPAMAACATLGSEAFWSPVFSASLFRNDPPDIPNDAATKKLIYDVFNAPRAASRQTLEAQANTLRRECRLDEEAVKGSLRRYFIDGVRLPLPPWCGFDNTPADLVGAWLKESGRHSSEGFTGETYA